jgi:hypothetical protein
MIAFLLRHQWKFEVAMVILAAFYVWKRRPL